MSESVHGPTDLELDTFGIQLESGLWRDTLGFLGPMKPGSGARANPIGWFPSGPDVGEVLAPIRAESFDGTMLDVHEARGSGPAVVSFLRSAVW